MEQINNFIETIKSISFDQFIDIIIAILIYVIFRILSKRIAYITIKLFKPRGNKKEIRQHGLYKPLVAFYMVLGAYLAVLFLKAPLNINNFIMGIINKIFKIEVIIVFANGFANILTVHSSFVRGIKEKISPDVDDAMFRFILKAIRCVIYMVAGFLVISELGYDLSGLVTGLGIGTVVITLAAQDIAKNLFGGLVIFLDKPFVVGDWIEVDSFEGTVEDITFRSTRVRTFDNSVVNIPNSLIANASIVNWSRMEKRRTKVNLCLELNTPLEKVSKVQERIREMLKQHDDVIDETIIVRFDDIKDNGINLLVYVYTNSTDYSSFIAEKEKINFNIMRILREEHVELAYDTKTVFVKN